MSRDLVIFFYQLRLPIGLVTVFIGSCCKVIVRVEVRETTKVPVSVRVRDRKQISRDCELASELVQAIFRYAFHKHGSEWRHGSKPKYFCTLNITLTPTITNHHIPNPNPNSNQLLTLTCKITSIALFSARAALLLGRTLRSASTDQCRLRNTLTNP